MCDQTEVSYKPDDIVWVRLSGIFWPAEVVDASSIDENITCRLKRDRLCIVKFFNEDKYEYPRNYNQISYFKCSKMDEYIDKGVHFPHRSGESFNKFVDDVQLALSRTGQSPAYVYDKKFMPHRTFLLESKSEKKTDDESSCKSDLVSSSSAPTRPRRLSAGRSLSTSDNCLSSPSSIKKSKQSKVANIPLKKIKSIRQNREPLLESPLHNFRRSSLYNCSLCGQYSSSRISNLVYHVNGHFNGTNPLRNQDSDKQRKSSLLNVKGNQQSPAKTILAKKKHEQTEPCKEALDLLKDWNELDDFNDEQPVDPREQNHAGSSTGLHQEIPENNCESVEDEKNLSPYKLTDSTLSPQSSKTPDKSCFDFEDNEDSINLDHTLKFGQKLPRVINEKSSNQKPKKTDSLGDPLSKEVDEFLETSKTLTIADSAAVLATIPRPSLLQFDRPAEGELVKNDFLNEHGKKINVVLNSEVKDRSEKWLSPSVESAAGHKLDINDECSSTKGKSEDNSIDLENMKEIHNKNYVKDIKSDSLEHNPPTDSSAPESGGNIISGEINSADILNYDSINNHASIQRMNVEGNDISNLFTLQNTSDVTQSDIQENVTALTTVSLTDQSRNLNSVEHMTDIRLQYNTDYSANSFLETSQNIKNADQLDLINEPLNTENNEIVNGVAELDITGNTDSGKMISSSNLKDIVNENLETLHKTESKKTEENDTHSDTVFVVQNNMASVSLSLDMNDKFDQVNSQDTFLSKSLNTSVATKGNNLFIESKNINLQSDFHDDEDMQVNQDSKDTLPTQLTTELTAENICDDVKAIESQESNSSQSTKTTHQKLSVFNSEQISSSCDQTDDDSSAVTENCEVQGELEKMNLLSNFKHELLNKRIQEKEDSLSSLPLKTSPDVFNNESLSTSSDLISLSMSTNVDKINETHESSTTPSLCLATDEQKLIVLGKNRLSTNLTDNESHSYLSEQTLTKSEKNNSSKVSSLHKKKTIKTETKEKNESSPSKKRKIDVKNDKQLKKRKDSSRRIAATSNVEISNSIELKNDNEKLPENIDIADIPLPSDVSTNLFNSKESSSTYNVITETTNLEVAPCLSKKPRLEYQEDPHQRNSIHLVLPDKCPVWDMTFGPRPDMPPQTFFYQVYLTQHGKETHLRSPPELDQIGNFTFQRIENQPCHNLIKKKTYFPKRKFELVKGKSQNDKPTSLTEGNTGCSSGINNRLTALPSTSCVTPGKKKIDKLSSKSVRTSLSKPSELRTNVQVYKNTSTSSSVLHGCHSLITAMDNQKNSHLNRPR